MRFYRIVVIDRQGRVLVPNVNGQPGFSHQPYDPSLSTYTSLNSGASAFTVGGNNPGALKIEIDVGVTYMDGPLPNSYVRVWGIGLAEIAQAQALAGNGSGNGYWCYIYGGMSKGLPLANPAQSGLIASGQIFQCFGNWVGTSQTLDIYLQAGASAPSSSDVTGVPGTTLSPTTNDSPANIVFQWKAGEPLLTPVINTLRTAYPQCSIVGAVHEGLVWAGATATGAYATVGQFAQYLRKASLNLIGGYAPASAPGSYTGVNLTLQNNVFTLSDGTTQTTPKQIQFTDLIGQPSWTGTATVQCACVLRADLHCGNYVTLPLAQGITSTSSNNQAYVPTPGTGVYSSLKNNSIFSGTFEVIGLHHVGDSRDPSAMAWTTVLNLQLASTGPSAVVPALPVVWSPPSGSANKYGFSI